MTQRGGGGEGEGEQGNAEFKCVRNRANEGIGLVLQEILPLPIAPLHKNCSVVAMTLAQPTHTHNNLFWCFRSAHTNLPILLTRNFPSSSSDSTQFFHSQPPLVAAAACCWDSASASSSYLPIVASEKSEWIIFRRRPFHMETCLHLPSSEFRGRIALITNWLRIQMEKQFQKLPLSFSMQITTITHHSSKSVPGTRTHHNFSSMKVQIKSMKWLVMIDNQLEEVDDPLLSQLIIYLVDYSNYRRWFLFIMGSP